MNKNIKVQGFVLLDVDVVALNNAGKNMRSNYDNTIKTKTIYKNGLRYVYVSGQAWRYWWRDSLQKNLGWCLSPVTRESKIAFTAVNPIKYPDDDLFGYMRTASEKQVQEDQNGNEEQTAKSKTNNVTVTRTSPLKNSALISVTAVSLASHTSSMARGDGDSVLYEREEYSTIMKGMFSIDVNMAGTFSSYNRSGYKNLSENLKKEAKDNGAEEIDDIYGCGKLLRLPSAIRKSRIADVILALKNISGGAMQTDNMADVTPKFIILATTNTGNHPFSHIVISEGEREERAKLNIAGLKEVITDYASDFIGKIFIGRRSGFFEEYDSALNDISNEKDKETDEGKSNIQIEYLPINAAIDKYVEQLLEQIDE